MTKTGTQNITPTLLLLLASVAAGWLYSYCMQGPGIDREVFRYAGMGLANGATPYTTFFDHKPPVIYFVYLLAHPFGIYGPQIVFTLFTFLVSLLVYRCCKKWLNHYALLFTVLWIVMMGDPLVMADGGQSRQFSALVVTALLAYGLLKKQNVNWWLMGMGAFLVFFTQVTDFPAMLPFLVWLMFFVTRLQEEKRNIPRNCMKLIAAFMLPAITLWCWFYGRNAHQAFFYSAFTFNAQWYVLPAFYMAKAKYTAVMLIKTAYLLPAAGLLLYRRSPFMPPGFVIVAGLAIQSIALIPGFFFNHYFIACIPYAFFGWVLLAAYTFSKWPVMMKWAPVVLMALLLFHIKPLYWLQKNTNSFEKRMVEKMKPYVREVADRRGQLFGLDQTPFLSLNASYNIISPSRWLYIHFWLRPDWDTRLDTFKTEVLLPLDSFRCRYIMDRETDLLNLRTDLKALWLQYTEEKYKVIFEEKTSKGRILFRLLRRKEE